MRLHRSAACLPILAVSLAAMLGVVAVALGAPPAPAGYTITDLGSLGGDASPAAINERGDVAGCSAISGFDCERAVLWGRGGSITDLGTLPASSLFSRATGLNDGGDVVGVAATENSSQTLPNGHAALWSRGRITDLGTLGGLWSEAAGIDNAGAVVGWSYTAAGDIHAFSYDKGQMRDINPAGATLSLATAISNSGIVVGWESLASGETRGFVRQNARTTTIGTLGGAGSSANGVNSRGDVVGTSNLPGNHTAHAFLYRNGTLTDLGSLGSLSEAFAVNERGQVVGISGIGDGSSAVLHATLWDAGQILDLNDLIPTGSGWFLSWATATNNRGQIVGFGIHNGHTSPFLLTPTH